MEIQTEPRLMYVLCNRIVLCLEILDTIWLITNLINESVIFQYAHLEGETRKTMLASE